MNILENVSFHREIKIIQVMLLFWKSVFTTSQINLDSTENQTKAYLLIMKSVCFTQN